MIVVDASIVVKIVAGELNAEAAYARIALDEDRIAPDWVRMEVVSALSGKVRRENFPLNLAREAMDSLSLYVPELVDSLILLDDAFALSIRLRHAVYDCLYLEAALRSGAVVVTADKEFANAARGGGFSAQVELLA